MLNIFGEKLKKDRNISGYSLVYVAEIIGVTPGFIGKLENGQSKPPIEILIKLSELFNDIELFFLAKRLPPNLNSYLFEDLNKFEQILDFIKFMSKKQEA